MPNSMVGSAMNPDLGQNCDTRHLSGMGSGRGPALETSVVH